MISLCNCKAGQSELAVKIVTELFFWLSTTTISLSTQYESSLYGKLIVINICLYTAVKTVAHPGSLVPNATWTVTLSQQQHSLTPYASYVERERQSEKFREGEVVVCGWTVNQWHHKLSLHSGFSLVTNWLTLMWPISKKPLSFTQSTTWLCLTQESTGTRWARAVIDQLVMKHAHTQPLSVTCAKRRDIENSRCVSGSEWERQIA